MIERGGAWKEREEVGGAEGGGNWEEGKMKGEREEEKEE